VDWLITTYVENGISFKIIDYQSQTYHGNFEEQYFLEFKNAGGWVDIKKLQELLNDNSISNKVKNNITRALLEWK
jgi:hypothetical protein